MREAARTAVEAAVAAGAQYADARAVEDTLENITVRNGVLRQLKQKASVGVGVRVLVDGAWGFYSTADITADALRDCARKAVEIARAAARVNTWKVELAPNPVHKDVFRAQVASNPFNVDPREKLERLNHACALLQQTNGVSIAEATMDFHRHLQFYVDSEGADIEQDLTFSGAGATATAMNQHDIQTRSGPNSFRGQFRLAGYEMIETCLEPEQLQRIAGESVALLGAKQCPAGVMDLVIASNQMALQIHESCGHPAEFDRILGQERNFAGESFMKPEHLGQLHYGSPLVNIYCDANEPGGLGTYAYDDEGAKAERFDIVRGGVLTNFLTGRDTARMLGQASNGTMRAEGWGAIPIIRMTNISLSPGDQTLEDLISGVDNGLYLETNRTWSIDNYRLNFQFGTELAYEIKNGKLGEMVKNAQYTGNTTEFWNSCTGVGDASTWQFWGVPNCGKGQPMQVAKVSHGAPVTRFANVKVGVGYAS